MVRPDSTWQFHADVLLLQESGKCILRHRTTVTKLIQTCHMQKRKEEQKEKTVEKATDKRCPTLENIVLSSVMLCHMSSCSRSLSPTPEYQDRCTALTCRLEGSCVLPLYGQCSQEELKWSITPLQYSWLCRCLLSKADSSPKVHLGMLHIHYMINLPFSGSTRSAVFMLHSLYLYPSDWKIPSRILWPKNTTQLQNTAIIWMSFLALVFELVSLHLTFLALLHTGRKA